jgi:hypothetical protein
LPVVSRLWGPDKLLYEDNRWVCTWCGYQATKSNDGFTKVVSRRVRRPFNEFYVKKARAYCSRCVGLGQADGIPLSWQELIVCQSCGAVYERPNVQNSKEMVAIAAGVLVGACVLWGGWERSGHGFPGAH